MRKFLRAFRYGERGFTLIELLIVVAILGILAAVIIPNVSTFIKTGTVNAANTEAENAKTAALAFYAENSPTWATSSDELGDFLTGSPMKADYTFEEGLISAAAPADNGAGVWTGIEWSGGTPGTGKWIRTP